MAYIHNDLVFGLVWRTAISDDGKELTRLSAETGANAYSEIRFDEDARYGFYESKKIDNLKSAAAVLVDILESGSGIFVHTLNETLVSCIVIRDKLPVEAMDLVGTRDYIVAQVHDYQLRRKNDETIAKVYGDLTNEFPGITPFKLSRLVSEADETHALKRIGAYDKRLNLVIGMILAASVVYFSGDLWDLVSPPAPQMKIDPVAVHRASVKAALDKVISQNQFPADVMAGFVPFVEQFPVPDHWELQTITCEDVSCLATWKRLPGGSTKGFLAAMRISNNDSSLDFPSVDQIRRKVSFKKQPSSRKMVLGTQVQFAKTIITWFQQLKDENRQPSIGQPVPLVAVPANIKLLDTDKPVFGEYAFTVPFSSLHTVAELPDLMTIEKITVTFKKQGDVDVEFKGKYYAL